MFVGLNEIRYHSFSDTGIIVFGPKVPRLGLQYLPGNLSTIFFIASQVGTRFPYLQRLVIEADGGASAKVDQVLLKAVARAHCWFAELVTGRSASMVAIAKREGVGTQYVSRLIRFAFLAPALVERIVEGRQPPELTAQSLLTGRVALPLSWAAQKQALGCVQHV